VPNSSFAEAVADDKNEEVLDVVGLDDSSAYSMNATNHGRENSAKFQDL
jgi:hypothetical protein